ncbi:hypothetical protein RND81_02G203300 [Saponaria officinalis]|uniref:CCHC-type domain-containing protein n=1 Tax=Saponaria officinalis TaxID=3572 RepID=A0AAW1MZ85_SAPOF
MTNLTKLEFVAFDITGKNYLSWVLDAEIHLDAKGLGETIKKGNKTTCQEKAKAMIFLRHHLHEGLKNEYLTVKDPQILWSNLKERYDHQKTVILPKARFKKYSELISCLLVAEQNNELLMKNHESRPTGSTPFPEANVAFYNKKGSNDKSYTDNKSRGRGRGRNGGRSRGRGFGGYGRGQGFGISFKKTHSHQKWDRKNGKGEKKSDNVTNICHRCGRNGHWSRVCRTPIHLVNLYQHKQKGKKVETNLVIDDNEGVFASGSATHLEVDDFLSTPEGTI